MYHDVLVFSLYYSIPHTYMGLSENRVYSQWNSHWIMISKTIGFRGTLFSDKPIYIYIIIIIIVIIIISRTKLHPLIFWYIIHYYTIVYHMNIYYTYLYMVFDVFLKRAQKKPWPWQPWQIEAWGELQSLLGGPHGGTPRGSRPETSGGSLDADPA